MVEQLARLGIGRLVLIDPDLIEEKNLNRILNSGKEDAYLGTPKVFALLGFGSGAHGTRSGDPTSADKRCHAQGRL